MPKTFARHAKLPPAGLADRLAVFALVADCGSFSAAARRLAVLPSSVTRQIDALEAMLGVAVLRRSTRRLSLTEAGECLLAQARVALEELERAQRVVADLSVEPRGVLRVGASATFGQRHVVPAVAAFLRRYPQLRLELHLDDDVVDLHKDRLDCSIRIGVLEDSTLIATKLAAQVRIACAAPSYLERKGIPRRPADLAGHDCLGMPGIQRPGWWRFGAQGKHATAKQGRVNVQGPFVCRSSEALLKVALDGGGIVHLPTWLVGDAVRDGRLIRLFAEQKSRAEAAAIYFIRPPGKLDIKTKSFLDHLREHIGSPPYWERAAG